MIKEQSRLADEKILQEKFTKGQDIKVIAEEKPLQGPNIPLNSVETNIVKDDLLKATNEDHKNHKPIAIKKESTASNDIVAVDNLHTNFSHSKKNLNPNMVRFII